MIAQREHRFRHHPLLDTVVEIRLIGDLEPADADDVDRAMVDQFARLERIFSAYDPDSELERWKRGEVDEPSSEFCQVMALALDWQHRSGGAFTTGSGLLTALWKEAAARGEPPTTEALTAAVDAIAEPSYLIDEHGVPRTVGSATGINLDALVKGWIVDRAVDSAAALAPDVTLVTSAGGDLAQRGHTAVRIGIENPIRPFDNEPPITTIGLRGAGLATSGRARRGFHVGGRWHGHVIDPRTGTTVDRIASISVVAHDAATADALATIAGLMEPDNAMTFTAEIGAACLVVMPTGERHSNNLWQQLETLA